MKKVHIIVVGGIPEGNIDDQKNGSLDGPSLTAQYVERALPELKPEINVVGRRDSRRLRPVDRQNVAFAVKQTHQRVEAIVVIHGGSQVDETAKEILEAVPDLQTPVFFMTGSAPFDQAFSSAPCL